MQKDPSDDELIAADAQRDRVAAGIPPRSTDLASPESTGRSRPPVVRRMLGGVYKLFRPVVRPLAWRARSFIAEPLRSDIQHLQVTLERVQRDMQQLREAVDRPDHARLELKRLADEMERVVLTLAMSSAFSNPANFKVANETTEH